MTREKGEGYFHSQIKIHNIIVSLTKKKVIVKTFNSFFDVKK